MDRNGEELGLEDKVAVVVGSSKGWGRGVALELARRGAKIVVNGTDASSVSSARDEIARLGAQVATVTVSAASMQGSRRIIDTAVQTFGRIDVLVNSAGAKRKMMLLEITEESLREALSVQLEAPFYSTYHAARRMVEQGRGGRIINMAGGAAVRGIRGKSQHAATKGGILAATLSWAVELADHGITVNAVRGGVRSPGSQPLIKDIRRAMQADGISPPRSDEELGFHEPQVAAQLVVWLASDCAADVTGQFVGTDGPSLSVWKMGGPVIELINPNGWNAEEIGPHLRRHLDGRPVGGATGGIVHSLRHVD